MFETIMATGFPVKHAFQDTPDWCGIACWYMLFRNLNTDIKNQKDLEKFISDKTWGTSHPDHEVIAKTYFGDYEVKEGWTTEEIIKKLAEKKFVIFDIWDDFNTDPPEKADGHYVVVNQISKGMVKIFDPSRSKRLDGKQRIFTMPLFELERRWYDFLDEAKTIRTIHWAIVVDPFSLILPSTGKK